jgi:hypothetical protein
VTTNRRADGDITIAAHGDALIDARAAATSVAVAAGPISLAVSGAGAGANNLIGGSTNATHRRQHRDEPRHRVAARRGSRPTITARLPAGGGICGAIAASAAAAITSNTINRTSTRRSPTPPSRRRPAA